MPEESVKSASAPKVIRKDTVALCIPCSGPVEPKVMINFMCAVNHAARMGIKLEYFGMTHRQLIHTARQNLAMGFLGSDAEWSLWLDSDMVLPKETISDLLRWAKALDAKIMTGIYHQRQGNFAPLAMLNVLRDEKGRVIKRGKDKYHSYFLDIPEEIKDAVKVDSCGFGCVLIHREVFEKMPQPFFKFLFGDDVPGMGPEEYISEDFYFCVKARELGYDIYALPSLDLGHLGDPPIVGRKDYYAKKAQKIEKIKESTQKI